MKSRFKRISITQAKSFNNSDAKNTNGINACLISTYYAGICAQYLHCLWMWVPGLVSTWRRREGADMQINQIYCKLFWPSGHSLRMHARLVGLDCTAVRGELLFLTSSVHLFYARLWFRITRSHTTCTSAAGNASWVAEKNSSNNWLSRDFSKLSGKSSWKIPWSFVCQNSSNDYYYDVQLPINHVISKTVLHLVAVCITSQKHSKHMLKVCRKFSIKI